MSGIIVNILLTAIVIILIWQNHRLNQSNAFLVDFSMKLSEQNGYLRDLIERKIPVDVNKLGGYRFDKTN